MIKKCYVLDGEIINIGEWVSAEQLPIGAIEEERDFQYTEDRGWFEVGEMLQPSETQILREENEILKSKLQLTEHMARETSQAQQELVELLIDMGVI